MKPTNQPIKKEEADEVDRSHPEMSKRKRDRAGRAQIPRVWEGLRADERTTPQTRATLHADLHLVSSLGGHPLQSRLRTGHRRVGSRTGVGVKRSKRRWDLRRASRRIKPRSSVSFAR